MSPAVRFSSVFVQTEDLPDHFQIVQVPLGVLVGVLQLHDEGMRNLVGSLPQNLLHPPELFGSQLVSVLLELRQAGLLESKSKGSDQGTGAI